MCESLIGKEIKGICFWHGKKVVVFPSESREGGVLRTYGTGFVLSGQSDCLDGAWAFARYLLTEEYQSGLIDRGGGLPTRRDVFEENVLDAAVMNIIYEEAESYFQGQKDVGSVADVIQNRVGLYLQEQMK